MNNLQTISSSLTIIGILLTGLACKRGSNLNEDLVDGDSLSVVFRCFGSLRHLPTAAEYRAEYERMISRKEISAPLPEPWSAKCRSLGKGDNPIKMPVEIIVEADGRSFEQIIDLDIR